MPIKFYNPTSPGRRAGSVIAPVSTDVIAAFGGLGGHLAIDAVAGLLPPDGS